MIQISQPYKLVRVSGAYLLNLLQAVFGTVIIESALYRVLPIHPKTREMLLLKEDLFTTTIAFLSGFIVCWKWKFTSAKWVWLIGVCWFGARALILPHVGVRAIWSQFSGIACVTDPAGLTCMNWFETTLPLFRTVFYSLGALFGSWTKKSGPESMESMGTD
ncbi:MAG TPA: hypothetical protein VKR43_08495 [Bryobacteraceae bacterium]|nr:hypothetical protein [Bryobacteraceae bacterium]